MYCALDPDRCDWYLFAYGHLYPLSQPYVISTDKGPIVPRPLTDLQRTRTIDISDNAGDGK